MVGVAVAVIEPIVTVTVSRFTQAPPFMVTMYVVFTAGVTVTVCPVPAAAPARVVHTKLAGPGPTVPVTVAVRLTGALGHELISGPALTDELSTCTVTAPKPGH